MDRSATPAPPDGRTVDPGDRRAHMRRQIAAHYGRVNDPNPDDRLTDEPTDNTGIGSDNNDTPSSLDPAEPWTLSAYRFATRFAGSFARASLNRRLDAGKEDASRLHERLGAPLTQRPAGNLIWIHGASVGEALSVLPLVARLGNLRPDLHFLVTTGTTTSASLMADRLPAQAFHQFIPVDYPPFIRQFLDHWRPNVALFVESEFWPNLLHEARARIPMMAIVNGRVSPTSFDRWRKRPTAIHHLLSFFDLIIAQDRDNAARLRQLSGRDVMLFGNLKHAADPLPGDTAEAERLGREIGDRPIWLAASTHPSEEAMIFDAHKILQREFRGILTMIAPRHPERGLNIEQDAVAENLCVVRRSDKGAIRPDTDIYLADTLGELGLFYRLNDIALVGGGLTPKGGHNPLEPARLGCSILHGPHIFNFNETYSDMRRAGAAALVRNDRDIAAAVKRLISDTKTRQAMAQLARNTAIENAERILCDITGELMEGIGLACPNGLVDDPRAKD
ncbi:MAG: 3-deoxy-D-manno-octulosonic acid transferase [Pseudomonadota bacterium]